MVETWGKHFVRNSPIAGSFARSPIRAVTTLTPLLRPARGGAAFLFLSLWKKTGGQAPVALRDWVPIEVHDWGGAGYWPCPRLAPRRLTGSACGV